MRHFRFSLLVTAVLLGLAAIWGYEHSGGKGAFEAVLIAAVLGVLEVSLSFDNAVVNAAVLRHWNAFWRKLFLTAGMLVAVFGMRLLFPLLIVAVATGLNLLDVWHMALHAPKDYARHLTEQHAEIAAFGGLFLLMVFLKFLFDDDQQHHWLGRFERSARRYGTNALAILIALAAAVFTAEIVAEPHRYAVLLAGVGGVATYLTVHYLSELLEEQEGAEGMGEAVQKGSIGGFIYLEVLDASFSFDGVIGAFAVSSDVVIIMLGLAIGAFFVRSLTIYLVEKGTLTQFVYLEHGAHYAIGALALIMLAGINYEIPEWVTALSGAGLIGLSVWSSLRFQRKAARDALT